MFVRSPWYRLSSSIVMLAVIGGALGSLFQRNMVGPALSGGVSGLLWPFAASLPLLRLSRTDRRATINAIRTGRSTGDQRLDRLAADRLATAALYRPDKRSNRIAYLTVAAAAIGIVVAASIVRSVWWVAGVALLLLVFTPMVVLAMQRPESDPDERLARLLSEMNADTDEID